MSTHDELLYVERSHEQAFAPPFLQGNCALYGFAVRASKSKLNEVCDRFLNEPAGGVVRYRPAADVVFIYFCKFGCTRSYAGDDAARGYLGENEFGIWMPVERTHGGASVPFTGPGLWPHLMVVDSGPAMITGREVYGFPKELGHITLPSGDEEPELFAADCLIFQRHRPSAAGRFGRLVEVRRTRNTNASGLQRIQAAKETLSSLSKIVFGDQDAGSGFAALFEKTLRLGRGQASFVMLKQFRDCADPRKAAYQAIVEAPTRTWKVSKASLLPDSYAITFTNCDSHPIVRDLGITAESLACAHGIFVDMSFDMEAGRVVWSSR